MAAGHAQRARIDNASERDDGHVRSAAANVHHQIAAGLGDGKTGANGGHHCLFHQVYFRSLGSVG